MFDRVLRFLRAMVAHNGSSTVLVCASCGQQNRDPDRTINLTGWTCGHCGRGPLVRITRPQRQPDAGPALAGLGVGALAGAAVAGPLGAIIGGALGFIAGTGAAKRKDDD